MHTFLHTFLDDLDRCQETAWGHMMQQRDSDVRDHGAHAKNAAQQPSQVQSWGIPPQTQHN